MRTGETDTTVPYAMSDSFEAFRLSIMIRWSTSIRSDIHSTSQLLKIFHFHTHGVIVCFKFMRYLSVSSSLVAERSFTALIDTGRITPARTPAAPIESILIVCTTLL